MSLSNSRTRLLLTVAALFVVALLVIYNKRQAQDSGSNKAEDAKNPTHQPGSRDLHDSNTAPYQKRILSKSKAGTGNSGIIVPNPSSPESREDPDRDGLRKLASESPTDAIAEVLNMAAGSAQKRAMAMVFDQWAKQDPTAAGKWLIDNSSIPQQLRARAAIALAKQWSTSEPENALQWSGTYFDQTDDHGAFQNAIITWAKQDPGAVGKHIAATSYGDTPDYLATMEFVNIYAQQDLEAAMQWVQDNTPQDLLPDAEVAIIDRLARKDPTRAAEYVLQNDRMVNIDSNLDALLVQWANTDIAAATAWVDNNLNPEHKETAYIQLAEISRDKQPALALQYAQALGDDKYRQAVTKDILSDWRDQNRGAADQWISENMGNLNPSVLEEVGYKSKVPVEP